MYSARASTVPSTVGRDLLAAVLADAPVKLDPGLNGGDCACPRRIDQPEYDVEYEYI
jgi:hypothetical protein